MPAITTSRNTVLKVSIVKKKINYKNQKKKEEKTIIMLRCQGFLCKNYKSIDNLWESAFGNFSEYKNIKYELYFNMSAANIQKV